jgi:hypothetical protein
MKKLNGILLLLAFSLVCLMPVNVQAYVGLDDELYNQLFYNAAPTSYTTGSVLIYRGWNSQNGYKTEMIKAIPHLNIINLTAQPLQFTNATGAFIASPSMVNTKVLQRNIAGSPYAYSYDLNGIQSDDYNTSPGPAATVKGDSEWFDGVNGVSDSTLSINVGNDSFALHLNATNRYNKSAADHADLVMMSLRNTKTNTYASSPPIMNNVINRGMVYMTGYTDATNGYPYEVFLVAGDRTNITFLVKYVNY